MSCGSEWEAENAYIATDLSLELVRKSIELGRKVGRAEEAVESKRIHGEWIPVSERLPEEKINPKTNDFEYVLCSTTWDDVRPYKFGKRIGENKAHFWLGGAIMDKYITAWQPLPEPYKKEGAV